LVNLFVPVSANRWPSVKPAKLLLGFYRETANNLTFSGFLSWYSLPALGIRIP
jgi:hypothetical protein